MSTVSTLTPNLGAASIASRASSASSLLGLDVSDFQSMFSSMLMSSGLGSSTSTGIDSSMGLSGASSSMGMMMMLPLMFAMFEKLLTRQMELLQSNKLVATPEPAPDAAATTLISQPSSSHANPYGEPVKGRLTQGYVGRHNGLDFGIVVGTPVHSTMEGTVKYAGWSPIGYGNLVIVENGDYQTYYAHLSKIPVSAGQKVQAGSVIGESGNTGNSTGPHLHYEIRKNGKNIDPTSLTLGKTI